MPPGTKPRDRRGVLACTRAEMPASRHDLAIVARTFKVIALSLSGEGDPRSRSSGRPGPSAQELRASRVG